MYRTYVVKRKKVPWLPTMRNFRHKWTKPDCDSYIEKNGWEHELATMIELNDDDGDDDIEDFEFPNVRNFGSTTIKETICRSKPSSAVTLRDNKGNFEDSDVPQSERNRHWQIFRVCSPVLDAWIRWNKSQEIEEKELCSFLNVSASSPSLQLVKSYLLGDHLSVSVEELKEVLEISDMLLLEDLANYCKYRIQGIELNEENFLQILVVSSLYDFVHPEMKHFVMSHLPLLTEIEGSEELTYDSVMFLLTDEVLTYWSMEERFHFITKWCKACVSRVRLFTYLFSLIDMTCLENDFIKSVVKMENLVRRSTQCLRRVDAILCITRKQTPVVIIVDTQTDVVFAFMLENKRSGNITFLSDISRGSIVAWSVLLPDCIIFITNDNTKKHCDIVKYNITTRKTISKGLHAADSNIRTDKITPFICQNDITFFVVHYEFPINKNVPVKVGGRNKLEVIVKEQVPFCTVYIKDKETTDTIWVVPVMSFKFEIMQMCVIKSRLLVKSCSDEHFYCFNWAKYTLTKTTIPQEMYSSPLLSLLPIDDTVCAVFKSFIILFAIDENTAEMKLFRKIYVDIGSDPFVTISTMEGTLVRVDNEYIHVCDSIQNSSPWKSYELPERTLSLSEKSVILHGFLRINVNICHQNCPHCNTRSIRQFGDGDADFGAIYRMKKEKKKEMKLQRKNEKLRRRKEREMKLHRKRRENDYDECQNLYQSPDEYFVSDDDDYYYQRRAYSAYDRTMRWCNGLAHAP